MVLFKFQINWALKWQWSKEEPFSFDKIISILYDYPTTPCSFFVTSDIREEINMIYDIVDNFLIRKNREDEKINDWIDSRVKETSEGVAFFYFTIIREGCYYAPYENR